MNIPVNLAKSCLLATTVFWLVIASKAFEIDMIAIVFLSMIPICIVVTVVILITICPFFWALEKEDFNKKQIFNTYHPYYTIVGFCICVFGIITSDYDWYITAFFTSAYITTNQSWIWFAKEK